MIAPATAPVDAPVDGDELIEAGRDLPAMTPRRRRPVAFWLACAWLALIVFGAVFADLLPLRGYDQPAGAPRQPPFSQLPEVLGTDAQGRSVLSRVVFGARASLVVGLVATTAGLVVGGTLGLLCGYLRGRFDAVVSLLVDCLLAFPPLVFLLTVTTVFRPQLSTLVVSLAIVVTPTFLRLQRSSTISWAARPFVGAARALGASRPRIIFREVFPNAVVSTVTFVPTVVAVLIIAEGSLSFLGIGIPSPQPSWGRMIADGRSQLGRFPELVFVPAAVVFLTVLSLNVIGERVRQRLEIDT